MVLPNIYAGDYKKLLLAPAVLLLLAAFFIPRIPQGIELKGGVLITLQTNASVDVAALEKSLSAAGAKEVSVSVFQNPLGTVVEISAEQEPHLADCERLIRSFYSSYDSVTRLEFEQTTLENVLSQNASQQASDRLAEVKKKLESEKSAFYSNGEQILLQSEQIAGRIARNASTAKEYRELVESSFSKAKDSYRNSLLSAVSSSVSYSSFSFKDVSPTLSEFFVQKATTVVIFAAILSAVIVFIVFRDFVPSIAVLTGAASDIAIAMGAMGLFQIPLTLPSFAALLMLIGFSLDTDVLLTMRVLKRTEGTARERAFETMKTGATMSSAAIVTFTVLFILSLATHIPTYYQISAGAIAGLLGDLVATWGFNAVIILWHLEKKGVA